MLSVLAVLLRDQGEGRGEQQLRIRPAKMLRPSAFNPLSKVSNIPYQQSPQAHRRVWTFFIHVILVLPL